MTASCSEKQRKVLNRLKRARGQLDAVISAVETGGNCRDVVTQLAAVNKALSRAGVVIIASAMEHCVVANHADNDARPTATPSGDAAPAPAALDATELTLEDLEKLLLMLS